MGTKNRAGSTGVGDHRAPCLYRGCPNLSTEVHLTCPEHVHAISDRTRLHLITSKNSGNQRERLAWLQRALRELQESADADARDSLQTKGSQPDTTR